MSVDSELDDTANFFGQHKASPSKYQYAIDDTNRLGMTTPESKLGMTPGKVHEYAEGIIRFYRARRILDGRHKDDGARRAWRYLEPLSPHDLPTSTRWHFLDLVYFMRRTENNGIEQAEFADRVRTIAGLIDDFVDRLNAELELPK